MKYKFNFGFHAFSVPSVVVDNLIKLARETDLKVLLYLLRHPDENRTAAQIALFLRISEEQASEALEFWINSNILQEKTEEKAKPVPEMAFTASLLEEPKPEEIKKEISSASEKKFTEFTSGMMEKLSMQEIADIIEQSAELRKLKRLAENQFFYGKNALQVRSLVWMHEYLGLSNDIIMLLLHYCYEINKFFPAYITKIAYDWWENEVITPEEANIKIEQLKAKNSYVNYIYRLFEMEARPTKTQKEFIHKWQEMQFSEEMLQYARDLNVEATGKLNFKYIDRILTSWKLDDIATVDQARRKREIYLQQLAQEIKNKKKKKKEEMLSQKDVVKKQEWAEIDDYLSIVNQFSEDDD